VLVRVLPWFLDCDDIIFGDATVTEEGSHDFVL
jgi:hypothetical protein